MTITLPTSPTSLGQVLATAVWEPRYGDPASDDRGRWVVETPSAGYLGIIAEPSTALVTVITRLRAVLEQDGIEVGDVAVLDGVVTAYAPADGEPTTQRGPVLGSVQVGDSVLTAYGPPAAPVGPAVATAMWEYGAWTVEYADGSDPDEICAGRGDAEHVRAELAALLIDEYNLDAVRVSPDGRTVTAYGLADADADSQPAGTTSGVEAPAAVTTPGLAGVGVPRAGVTPAPTTTDPVGGVVSPLPPSAGPEPYDPTPALIGQGASGLPRLLAALADGSLEPPSETDLYFHRQSSPDLVRTWADLLGLPAPSYSDVKVLSGHDLYRSLKSSGTFGSGKVEITGFIDLAADSSGLEGTGWLDAVWVAAARKGVAAHRPDGPERTVCGRSTRTGIDTTARQATDRHGASFGCAKCWPAGSPIVTDAGGAR